MVPREPGIARGFPRPRSPLCGPAPGHRENRGSNPGGLGRAPRSAEPRGQTPVGSFLLAVAVGKDESTCSVENLRFPFVVIDVSSRRCGKSRCFSILTYHHASMRLWFSTEQN